MKLIAFILNDIGNAWRLRCHGKEISEQEKGVEFQQFLSEKNKNKSKT